MLEMAESLHTEHGLHTLEGARVTRRASADIDVVVARFRARMGRLTITAVIDMARKAGSVDEFESEVRRFIPDSGFVIFDEIDHGAWLQRYGLGLKSLCWPIGNPLITVTMIRHDATAGLFVPLELLFTEDPGGEGCTITYVVPSSLMRSLTMLPSSRRPGDSTPGSTRS